MDGEFFRGRLAVLAAAHVGAALAQPAGVASDAPTTLCLQFSRETIAMRPERTLRADAAFGIVFSFFVSAADDPFKGDDRLDMVLFQEILNLCANGFVAADIPDGGDPFVEDIHFLVAFVSHDPDNGFGHELVGWPVKSQCCGRVLGRLRWTFLFHASTP